MYKIKFNFDGVARISPRSYRSYGSAQKAISRAKFVKSKGRSKLYARASGPYKILKMSEAYKVLR